MIKKKGFDNRFFISFSPTATGQQTCERAVGVISKRYDKKFE